MAKLRSYQPIMGTILSMVGSFASMLGLLLVLTEGSWPWWAWVGVGVSTVFLLLAGTLEVKALRTSLTFANNEAEKIRDYMYRWLSSGGRVAVWTRDHSWVDDDEMRELLERKAKKSELILCLPTKTPLAEKLEGLGAEVVAYGKVPGVPSARFTIAQFDRDGSGLAIGRSNSRGHVIEEHEPGADVVFHLAEDLVRLAQALNKESS